MTSGRIYTDGKVDYSKCRTKEFFRRGIERIRNAYNQGLRVCLLCSEGKPWQCHRSKLVGKVERRSHTNPVRKRERVAALQNEKLEEVVVGGKSNHELTSEPV